MSMKKIFVFTMLALSLFGAKKSNAETAWTMVNCNPLWQQADCHALDDQGVLTMVDAGTKAAGDRYVVPYLRKRGKRVLNNFVISHPHNDHYGGLESILNAGIKVNNIYFNRPPMGVFDAAYVPAHFEALLARAARSGSILHNVERGDTINLPTSKITILEARKERQAGGVNDYSIVMRWEAGGYTSLFTGDLNRPLSEKLKNDPLFEADFYKAPHHGVTGIASDEFSDTVDPSIVLVPTTKHLWTHERGEQFNKWANKRYREKGMMTCINGFNGEVKLSFEQQSVHVKPEINELLCEERRLYLKPKVVKPLPSGKVDISAIIMFLMSED